VAAAEKLSQKNGKSVRNWSGSFDNPFDPEVDEKLVTLN
jgi:hypothetical protein